MPISWTLDPKVDTAAEFLEIARDFTNPLEAVREAISNSFDAGAKLIHVLFEVRTQQGEGQLVVTFQDNGHGMDKKGLHSFFDLGNSSRRGDSNAIGTKGHGTKVFFGCEKLVVETIGTDRVRRRATMLSPLQALHDGRVPAVSVEEDADIGITIGTRIALYGFNRNRRDTFTQEQLKDYILWFTKFGSIETDFGITSNASVRLLLRGVDAPQPVELKFGHVFAKETKDLDKLFDKHLTDAPKHYARKWVRVGNLINHPELQYHAVFAIEGDLAKRSYNKMITSQGRQRRSGMYKVTDRYGLYLCKDFIPIERTDGWLGARSTDHLRYHAFINCQGFQLTANRGSVTNTPQPILDDIRAVADIIRSEIAATDEYDAMEYLDQQAYGHETLEREAKQYKRRVNLVQEQKAVTLKGTRLIQPRQESGVFALVTQLLAIKADIFPFEIVDYDTVVGIDALAKSRDCVPVQDTLLRYLEFKFLLEKRINHSFANMSWIVCWDLHHTVKHECTIEDLASKKFRFQMVPGKKGKKGAEATRYFLDSERESHKIEVFVLKTYIKEVLGLEFK